MLQAFSDRIRKSRWLGYAIVAFISVPFALWGIQAYFSGPGDQVAAEVDGIEITARALDQRVSERRQQLREQFDEVPEELTGSALRERVLDDMITRELLTAASMSLGLRAGDAAIAEYIRQQPYFQRDGRFDPELYRETLRFSGISPAEYEESIRRSARISQLQGGVLGSTFSLEREALQVAQLDRQSRQISLLRLSLSSAAEQVELDDDEVRAYYTSEQDRFMTPEQVRVSYVLVDREEMAAEIDVPESEIRSEYDRQRDQLQAVQQREAAHILIENGDDAEERAWALHERITDEGEDFHDLAREYSEDIGSANDGGRLGEIDRGDMVEPFDDALFALSSAGDVSEPVRTQFGYHLIKLMQIHAEEGPSFADERDRIEREIRARRVDDIFHDVADGMIDAAFANPSSLEPAAEAGGLDIRESEWFSRDAGEDIAESRAVRNAAFSQDVFEDGMNSDLIELGDGSVLVLRLADHRSPEPRDFAEVEEEVRAELRRTRAREVLDDWFARIESELEAGSELDDVLESDIPIVRQGPLSISLTGDEWHEIGPDVRRLAFGMTLERNGHTWADLRLMDGDHALVVLHAVEYPEPDEMDLAEMRSLLGQLWSDAELEAWLEALRDEASIEINRRVVDR